MVAELLEDKKLWDGFVENSPHGLLFHRWDFLKTVERHSGFKLLPYGIFSGDELICIFPFFVNRSKGLSLMVSPPPNASVPHLGFAFGPNFEDFRAQKRERVIQQVADEMHREIKKISPNFASFLTVPKFVDVRPFKWKNYSVRLKFTYAIDLEKPIEQIWSGFSKSCKQGIKRLSALGPQVEQTRNVDLVYNMLRERYDEQGLETPLFSDDYIQEIAAAFPKNVTVYSVSLDGTVVGSTVCCEYKDRFYNWQGSVNLRKELQINEYLVWEEVKKAKSEGFKKLDLTGANTRSICAFKSKFDPLLEPYCYVEKTDALGKTAKLIYENLGKKRLLHLRAKRKQ